ncbi:SUMF1/EgtB/PvdO family nonheme iron enzyme [Chitinophaga flava]|uniref:Sulfatase-modifying factor enzyme-like domain-containing protein n=1 Tax=Chitinophaga flava TaxID=2259036 RepID=A0A365Y130_9BACT|nr:SUMF1/EgtB/PvdO family nonheme iron enzyme [Chitinophaga flava]RBL91951.1 hypothetical protein DF182_04950 [Chitinophaga flava]
MNVTQIYDRKAWNALPHTAAEAILQYLIETKFPEFTIKHFEQFDKFNQRTYTAVLDYQGTEFVFVPGDTVLLGLDQWNMPEENKINMVDMFENNEEEMDNYIRERLSPVRTVTIPPMIVERQVRETGYFPVDIDDERLVSDDYFHKTLKDLKASPREQHTWIVNSSFRLEKNGTDVRAFLYEPASYDELTEQIADSGFRLPTEDEWEYLCGGGSRTLYPWGDGIDYDKKYHHFVAEDDDGKGFYLDTPNHFGIVIANDPYHYEVMMDSEWFIKSGDGGCNLCGGGGWDMGYLSIGTYFRDPFIFDEEMAYKDEITGDYSFVRRLKRVE